MYFNKDNCRWNKENDNSPYLIKASFRFVKSRLVSIFPTWLILDGL